MPGDANSGVEWSAVIHPDYDVCSGWHCFGYLAAAAVQRLSYCLFLIQTSNTWCHEKESEWGDSAKKLFLPPSHSITNYDMKEFDAHLSLPHSQLQLISHLNRLWAEFWEPKI
jgi:hypothetical protein